MSIRKYGPVDSLRRPGPPRILHLLNSFQQGGTERQTVQLVRQLCELDMEVHVACQRREGPLEAELEDLNLKSIPTFPLTKLYDANAGKQMLRFARHLRDLRIDILHVHDFYTNVFGLPASALAGTPVRIGSKRELGMLTSGRRAAERFAFRFASSVIANCYAARNRLLEMGLPSARVVTIHNGVTRDRVAFGSDATRSRVMASFELAPLTEGPVIVMVSNLRHRLKDHTTLLRAAHVVVSQHPDAAFLIAGEGELLNEMRTLATDLGISGSVRFIGRCDRIGDLLHIADVCVLSSRSESLPNVVLEYMAAGKPVVATDVGGVGEAVLEGVTGFLVMGGDSSAIARRVLHLLRNPELARRMGERGRARIDAEFSADLQLQRTCEVYERLLARPELPTGQPPGGNSESFATPSYYHPDPSTAKTARKKA